MASFQIGDIVELKSGGPYMTVTNTTARAGSVGCCWFVSNDYSTPHEGFFPPESLKKAEES